MSQINITIEKSKEEVPLTLSTDTIMCAINTETGPQLIVTSNETEHEVTVFDLYAFTELVKKFRKRLLKNNPWFKRFLRSKYSRKFKRYLKGDMGVKTKDSALKDPFEE